MSARPSPLLLVVVLLASTGCGTPTPRPGAPGGRVPSATAADGRPAFTARDIERGVHDATNAARRRHGERALSFDEALAAVARRHSADMARRGFFSHTAPDGSDANARARHDGLACQVETRGRRYTGFSENLAEVWLYSRWRETRGPAGTQRTYQWRALGGVVAETVDGWLASPGHRRNLLLDRAAREGVGAFVRDDGAVYVTQMLC